MSAAGWARVEEAWEPGCGSALGRGISEFQIPGISRLTNKLMKPSQNKIQSAGIVAQYLTGMREAPVSAPVKDLVQEAGMLFRFPQHSGTVSETAGV